MVTPFAGRAVVIIDWSMSRFVLYIVVDDPIVVRESRRQLTTPMQTRYHAWRRK